MRRWPLSLKSITRPPGSTIDAGKRIMSKSDKDKLQRLLDYHLTLDDPAQRSQTEEMLSQDQQTKSLSDALANTLKPLGSWSDEPAPVGLAQRTMDFIIQKNQAQLQSLAKASAAIYAQPDSRKTDVNKDASRSRWIFGNLRDMIAVAASIMFLLIISQPSMRYMRDMSRRQQCADQMARIGSASEQYSQSNAGQLPYVSAPAGSPWWQQKNENNRNNMVLVRKGYLPERVLQCPGARLTIRISPQTARQLQEFSESPVNYSFRLVPDASRANWKISGPIMADKNPLFAERANFHQGALDLGSDSSLRYINSPNHNRQGQNVLYRDGSVQFSDKRQLDGDLDDIFTIEGTSRYEGRELPANDDIFIAP